MSVPVRLFLLLAALLLATPARARADSDALWRIVHGQCVPDQLQHADPAPCAQVALADGWAVLKDRRGVAQFLLIPTARVTGIEDPAILAPGAPNYFAAAWAERGRTQARLPHPVPRDALALAINSPSGRSQNQLHIHIDCLRADVRAALRAHVAVIGPDWAPLPGGLLGHPYLARRLDGAEFGTANPFRLLAQWPGVGAAGLRPWTLVVAGAADGFILLADRADPRAGDPAEGEEVQDHDCALAHAPAD
ncbi:MAG: CDP-diacylglycerol diphosphatase [Rhodospirillales bacterium]|nr:CDP-diacylglycerol diphosphatase [Rhodospirillales bacterium]